MEERGTEAPWAPPRGEITRGNPWGQAYGKPALLWLLRDFEESKTWIRLFLERVDSDVLFLNSVYRELNAHIVYILYCVYYSH